MTQTTYNILVLPGDGIGPEIMREATKVLQTFTTPTRAFALREELIGGCSIDATGQSCTEAVKQAALASDAVLFAAVGGPKWDGMRRGLDGPEGGLLQLRKAMDIYGNLRPCAADVPSRAISREYSPFRQDVIEGVDFVVVRENCGGAYFGKKVEEPEYGMHSLPFPPFIVSANMDGDMDEVDEGSNGRMGLLDPRNPTHHPSRGGDRPAP